ncbi:MAG: fibronectin type III domain-containing protein [Chloroflexi bacterium]|nr:fibronectin type III domain-containing protein [Chloroflexota bacterium]
MGYKDRNLDPIGPNNPLNTVTWREAPVNQPENALIGVMYESRYDWGISYPWVVQNAGNWVYQGTGLTNGDQIAGLVGYEYDKVWNNGQTPAGLTVLSASPVVDLNGLSGVANGAIYTHASGAVVFAAGTIYWAWKLDDNEYQNYGADARVQRMTANILARMITGVAPTATPSPKPMASPGSTIYTESLASGWTSQSWRATVNLASTTQAYAGTKAISFATTGAYGSITLTRSSAMSVSGLCSAFTPAVTGVTSGGSAPAPPSAMAVTGTTGTSVTVGWTGNSSNETNFRVAYTTSSFTVYQFQSVPANSTSWTHSGLTTGDTYYYWVQSCIGALCTAWAGGIVGTAGSAPPPPSNVQATNVTPTSVTLSSTDNSSSETRFDLAWTANNDVSWTVVPLSPNTVSWLHSGVTAGTEYVYFVHALHETMKQGGPVGAALPAATIRDRGPHHVRATRGFCYARRGVYAPGISRAGFDGA